MIGNGNIQRPGFSIIIRTKNEEQFIDKTLSAIFQQDIDLHFEVIVIDSGSTDRTLDIVRRHAVRIHEIEAGDFSYGRALNLGASLAEGQYIVNLSAHCIPTDSRWIATLLSNLRTDPGIAATYGRQIPIIGLNPFEERSLIAVFTPNSEGRIYSPFSNANCAIRKTVWKKYPFDEKASFAEDFIWSQVLPREHEIRYVPEAQVYHSHPLRLKYWAKRSYDNGVLAQYLEHVYGFQYKWGGRTSSATPKEPYLIGVFGAAARHVSRCLQTVIFLVKKRYLKFIPIYPIFFVLEQYFYRKGLADGYKLYGQWRG